MSGGARDTASSGGGGSGAAGLGLHRREVVVGLGGRGGLQVGVGRKKFGRRDKEWGIIEEVEREGYVLAIHFLSIGSKI